MAEARAISNSMNGHLIMAQAAASGAIEVKAERLDAQGRLRGTPDGDSRGDLNPKSLAQRHGAPEQRRAVTNTASSKPA